MPAKIQWSRIVLTLSALISSLISCKQDEPIGPVSVDELIGSWVCVQSLKEKCENPDDNGTDACNGAISFFEDFTVVLYVHPNEYTGTFVLEGNQLLLTLEVGVEDGYDFGTIEADPITIKIQKDIMTYKQTLEGLDGCMSTLKLRKVE